MNTRANAATTYKGVISRGYEQEIGTIGYPASLPDAGSVT
jgi:hypothetical protein